MIDLFFAANLCLAVDGDTLRCGEDRIRLHGIDAPDFNCNGRGDWCRQDVRAAERSRQHLAGLIEGRDIKCERRDVDRYRRAVAVCWTGALHVDQAGPYKGARWFVKMVDLNCEMVRAGHAIDWPRYSGGAYAKCAR